MQQKRCSCFSPFYTAVLYSAYIPSSFVQLKFALYHIFRKYIEAACAPGQIALALAQHIHIYSHEHQIANKRNIVTAAVTYRSLFVMCDADEKPADSARSFASRLQSSLAPWLSGQRTDSISDKARDTRETKECVAQLCCTYG